MCINLCRELCDADWSNPSKLLQLKGMIGKAKLKGPEMSLRMSATKQLPMCGGHGR